MTKSFRSYTSSITTIPTNMKLMKYILTS